MLFFLFKSWLKPQCSKSQSPGWKKIYKCKTFIYIKCSEFSKTFACRRIRKKKSMAAALFFWVLQHCNKSSFIWIPSRKPLFFNQYIFQLIFWDIFVIGYPGILLKISINSYNMICIWTTLMHGCIIQHGHNV